MVSRLARYLVKEGADIGSALNFVTDAIKFRRPVQELGIAPTFLKKVDEKGKIQKPLFGARIEPRIFGKQIFQGK